MSFNAVLQQPRRPVRPVMGGPRGGGKGALVRRGQVIVGLLHQDMGYLGIFVSGQVATKEHLETAPEAGALVTSHQRLNVQTQHALRPWTGARRGGR